jgi:hypothetical protein
MTGSQYQKTKAAGHVPLPENQSSWTRFTTRKPKQLDTFHYQKTKAAEHVSLPENQSSWTRFTTRKSKQLDTFARFCTEL